MAIGPELIKQARRAAGLTQAELGRRARTSQSAVAAYESGAKTPSVETLERLLRATGQRLGSGPAPQSGRRRSAPLSRLLRSHRSEILAIARKHHASNVRVFGSVARRQDRSGSDVDLLVDVDPAGSLLDQVRLRRALIGLLGVEVDVVSSNGLLPRDSAILDEAVPL
jgi:predicted nucleotidyltransferase/DNA-binding XRE family transcriptional regulator